MLVGPFRVVEWMVPKGIGLETGYRYNSFILRSIQYGVKDFGGGGGGHRSLWVDAPAGCEWSSISLGSAVRDLGPCRRCFLGLVDHCRPFLQSAFLYSCYPFIAEVHEGHVSLAVL